MNGVDAVRSACGAAYHWYDGTVADVDDEQAKHVPQGRAHNIAALAAHVVQSEDWLVNSLLQGKPMIWAAGNWEEQTGVPNVTQLSEGAVVQRDDPINALAPYRDAVRSATAAYLDGLSDQDLDREIDLTEMGMEPMRLGDVILSFGVANTLAHTGEISAIKGTLGARGYPF